MLLLPMEISCRIIESCIKKRLQWNSCFARKVCKESEYYEEMMRYLRKNLAVCAVQNVYLALLSEIVYQIICSRTLYAYPFVYVIKCYNFSE